MLRNHSFPLFNSHIDLAHAYWKSILASSTASSTIIIDATCGNGCDTLFLAQGGLSKQDDRLLVIDKQSKAIEITRNLLQTHLSPTEFSQVEFYQKCHSTFPEGVPLASVSLIVYNLGYLPRGNKAITTLSETTLQSLNHALLLVKPGGLISVTCYPGHKEGAEEELLLLNFVSTLSPAEWSCCHHRWLNRTQAPSLLLIQRNRL